MAKLITLPERPWPIDWEARPEKDACAHQWETVVTEVHPGSFDTVNRCCECHTPRCDRDDDGPCVERRHHSGLHIFEGGSFDPVGGHLRDGA